MSGLVQIRFRLQLNFNSLEPDSEVGQLVYLVFLFIISLTVPVSASEQLLIEDGDNHVIRNQEGVLLTWDQDQVFFRERG